MMSTLEECTNCGYVSAALEEHEAGVSEGVISAARSSVDSQQLEHMLIGPCIVRSKLDESLGNLALAAEYALWAAWVADDDNTQDAKPYRYKAAELFARAAASLPSESESALVMKARLIDVFRRAEKWNDAIKLANNLFASDGLSPIMRQVVTFSRKMAVERSSCRFTVQEAVADS